ARPCETSCDNLASAWTKSSPKTTMTPVRPAKNDLLSRLLLLESLRFRKSFSLIERPLLRSAGPEKINSDARCQRGQAQDDEEPAGGNVQIKPPNEGQQAGQRIEPDPERP